MLANLHQIRLYIHHILEEQFAAAHISLPPKVDFQCVDSSFNEMRNDGFVDDGLFDRMKKFFLPLTTTEQELNVSNERWEKIEASRKEKLDKLREKLSEIVADLQVIEDQYYTNEDFVKALTTEMDTLTPGSTEKSSLEEQINEYRRDCDNLEPQRKNLHSQVDQINDTLQNIEQTLDRNKQNSGGRDLIKPNRGFIMYGPPGK